MHAEVAKRAESFIQPLPPLWGTPACLRGRVSYNELLTYLGINNTLEKKERLIVDETNSNNQFIKMSSDIGFKLRQSACEQMNEKFGLNIRVVETQDEFQSEVMENVRLNDDNSRDEE